MVPEPQFSHGIHDSATTYVSSDGTGVTARKGLPGHPRQAVRNVTAPTDDESYHGSTSELPPAASHRYAEWDFSSVSDPVMFRRFLDVADYWFGYSDTSSAGSYDPAHECCMVAVGDRADGASSVGAGDGEPPRDPGASVP
jgi:hypothetical protein